MRNNEQYEFVEQLARDLSSGDISLPSLPDVVIKIRKLLEQESCDFAQVSKVVSADPVLVSKLFVFANSAYHNQNGEPVENLDAALGRLGLQLVRDTAISLAVKQLFLAEKHKCIASHVREIWARSMQFSCMSFAIAESAAGIDQESAFMCGLLHEIGKLYIITRAQQYPTFLGNDVSLQEVMDEWHPQVGRCIVESWGFPTNIVQSMDPGEFLNGHSHTPADLVDVVVAAKIVLNNGETPTAEHFSVASCRKLDVCEDSLHKILNVYQEKLSVVRQSLAN